MGTPVEEQPSLEGHGDQQQYVAYDPRGNGLSRRPTYPVDDPNTQPLAPNQRNEDLSRSMTDPATDSDPERLNLAPRERERDESKAGSNRSRSKICGKCGEPLTGQFVRALGDTYHLECFTCHDCGKIVASKFFPVPEKPPNQYPLCETDYFRRLDLLCHECGQALRGSYITALDRKYHIEHFTCSVCPTVFGAQDSYYEHEGNVYCHFHYSTKFAQRCHGCQTSILKQFVEIFRNGQNQHWHPECYMIHKYWNVRLHSTGQPVIEDQVGGEDTELIRETVRRKEEEVEAKVNWIWKTLSSFEEKSATCISDMLLHVSNGAYFDGVMAAKKFIVHVDLLFSAADDLDAQLIVHIPKGLSYSREAKLLCKKVVAFFALLTQSQDTGVRRLGVTQELLSLVTGLAHYLKLLIRICLQGALKLERETNNPQGLTQFLTQINSLDDRLAAEENGDQAAESALYVPRWADACPVCDVQVEDKCVRLNYMSFNNSCMICQYCGVDLRDNVEDARFSPSMKKIFCKMCAVKVSDAEGGFVPVSKLRQYVHLLKVAHARLLATLRSSGALPHTSDDPNLTGYDSTQGHRLGANGNELEPPGLLRSDTRSKSFAGSTQADTQGGSSYEQTMTDIRRLRSTRLDKHLSNTMKRARTSRIIDGPEAYQMETDGQQRPGMQIVQERDAQGDLNQQTLGVNSLALDDIARMAALEQQREQRPNAFRAGGSALLGESSKPKLVNGHRRDVSGGNELDRAMGDNRPRTYFSELSPLEYFKLKSYAVLQLGLLLDDSQYNQGELLDLIETKRSGFWGKIGLGNAFKNDKSKKKKDSAIEKPRSDKAIFRQTLEYLVEKCSAESTDGVGPGTLKVPALLQDCITAMRSMDMSVEGVFRKNGNLRLLRELEEEIDANGSDEVDLGKQTPVIVANVLKRFLRYMPDPVLTLKLYRLFMTANEIPDVDKRKRVLHLICCLLPKAHRDTMEVLFNFLNWVSSFHTVDEESGNKMDTWNLATVIAPNILRENNDKEQKSVDQGAVRVVSTLIECNESMCEVPDEIVSLLYDDSSQELTTKEIMRRWEQSGKVPQATVNNSPKNPNQSGPPRTREGQQTAPQITQVDESMQSWQSETSVRHVGAAGNPNHGPSSAHNTPPQGYQDLSTPNLPYANTAPGSAESHRTGSPHRHSYRSPAFQRNGQLGTAGAG
ncbi:rho-type GTPase-activating protein-like protein [Delitschia confertaspora ATCC 74209]|uniref:Rho-type GTPase-activating protein-like protein n=1 Tax=Delitschia confertaspora ATCC 74209 TaxID=1513339 RepID=A0A9P4JJF7_9PLEO|nr:rho-type GTPase-activating protein-like protein [Delitschia confertaspora ATCC 74209]